MPLKKSLGDGKRASLLRSCDFSKSFVKDWERLNRSGRYDMHRLKEVMLLLVANDAPLGPEWLEHLLKGEWFDHRECHIGGDFLLIYQTDDRRVVFARTGTHAELFG